MGIVKIIFALILTIIFFIELLEEKKTKQAILCIIAYILFAVIVINRSFF